MSTSISPFALAPMLAGALLLTACVNGQWPWAPTEADEAEQMSEAPKSGRVTDLEGFATFIDLRPTPDQFRERYPDVHLVMPGDITTKELRMDNSRFFAELDDSGLITGGRFQ
jgi:hypothetical protein